MEGVLSKIESTSHAGKQVTRIDGCCDPLLIWGRYVPVFSGLARHPLDSKKLFVWGPPASWNGGSAARGRLNHDWTRKSV